MYTNVYKIVSGRLLYDMGGSAQCSVVTWRGGVWGGGREAKKGGIYVYVQLIHSAIQQKLTQDYKAMINKK